MHWADITEPNLIVVIQSPVSYAAAVGGLIGLRLQHRQTRGVVVGGRVRDMEELQHLSIPVIARRRHMIFVHLG
jgi:regulator of RNase E activity RraA